MAGDFYAGGENGVFTFILITLLMGGLAAYASGKAIAQTWRPFRQVPLYMLVVALAVRFCHFALFEEELFSLPSYMIDFAVALAAGSLGYRLVRARQMTVQYGWMFQRRGLLAWRALKPHS
jgi:uncharacterized membrane protein